ncbi:MAG: GNAT family N-acetyltransferase [Agriterribacter sp.]
MVLRNADIKDLERAAADNHRQLFCTGTTINAGEVYSLDGLTYTYTSPALEASVAFPEMDEMNAGKQLDQMMKYYGRRKALNVGCWSLVPSQPLDLGVRLLARGFQPGWQPCWMAADLKAVSNHNPIPTGISIQQDNESHIAGIKDLPYNQEDGYLSTTLLRKHPETARRLVAIADTKIVGQCCIFFSTGALGVAGIYNVGVIPSMRNKGIGRSLVLAACILAKEGRYEYATLNANHTGRPVYEKAGFEFLGYGITWWLIGENYFINPPSANIVALAEAVGRGDIAMLNNLYSFLDPADLNKPLSNGMTLIQLAAECNQPGTAMWLIDHGAAYTVLDAWNFKWKEKVDDLIARHPAEINRLYYSWNGTLMHIAAQRNDIELAKLALSSGIDLAICDTDYQGNALGWAIHFNRPEIIKLIQERSK